MAQPYRNVQLTEQILKLVVGSGFSELEVRSALSAVANLIPGLSPNPLPLTPTSEQKDKEHREWMKAHPI